MSAIVRFLATWSLTRVISSCSLRILGMGGKPQKNDSLPGSLDMLILRTLPLSNVWSYTAGSTVSGA
jgi:hypothetical protein